MQNDNIKTHKRNHWQLPGSCLRAEKSHGIIIIIIIIIIRRRRRRRRRKKNGKEEEEKSRVKSLKTIWILLESWKKAVEEGNFWRETEFLLIAAQNSAIRTNHIKARIDKTQQNSKCRLCGDRDETINHISGCSKLAQKEYKTRHDWVGKVIHWEMCKKFKFDHTNNPAPVLENDTHKIQWDFDIYADHLISARPYNNQQKKTKTKKQKQKKNENMQNCRLCCLGWPQNKIERMWKQR